MIIIRCFEEYTVANLTTLHYTMTMTNLIKSMQWTKLTDHALSFDIMSYHSNRFSDVFCQMPAWKVYVFGVFLAHIFPLLDWIRKDDTSAYYRHWTKIKMLFILYFPIVHSEDNIYVATSLFTVSIYLFKVTNRNTRTISEICSSLTIKIPGRSQWGCFGVFRFHTLP